MLMLLSFPTLHKWYAIYKLSDSCFSRASQVPLYNQQAIFCFLTNQLNLGAFFSPGSTVGKMSTRRLLLTWKLVHKGCRVVPACLLKCVRPKCHLGWQRISPWMGTTLESVACYRLSLYAWSSTVEPTRRWSGPFILNLNPFNDVSSTLTSLGFCPMVRLCTILITWLVQSYILLIKYLNPVINLVYNQTMGWTFIEMTIEDMSLEGMGFKTSGPDYHDVDLSMEFQASEKTL